MSAKPTLCSDQRKFLRVRCYLPQFGRRETEEHWLIGRRGVFVGRWLLMIGHRNDISRICVVEITLIGSPTKTFHSDGRIVIFGALTGLVEFLGFAHVSYILEATLPLGECFSLATGHPYQRAWGIADSLGQTPQPGGPPGGPRYARFDVSCNNEGRSFARSWAEHGHVDRACVKSFRHLLFTIR